MPSSTRSRSGDDATTPMTAYSVSLRKRAEPSPSGPAGAATASGSGVGSLAKGFAPGEHCAAGAAASARAAVPVHRGDLAGVGVDADRREAPEGAVRAGDREGHGPVRVRVDPLAHQADLRPLRRKVDLP